MLQGFETSPTEDGGPSILELLAAILLVLVVILLSAYFRLGLHKATLIATLRQDPYLELGVSISVIKEKDCGDLSGLRRSLKSSCALLWLRNFRTAILRAAVRQLVWCPLDSNGLILPQMFMHSCNRQLPGRPYKTVLWLLTNHCSISEQYTCMQRSCAAHCSGLHTHASICAQQMVAHACVFHHIAARFICRDSFQTFSCLWGSFSDP